MSIPNQPGTKQARLFILLGFLGLLLNLSACGPKETGEPVQFGPEVAVEDVEKTLAEPLQDRDPFTIQVGEFVHFAETQELANGAVKSVSSDTGQTVVERNETTEELNLTVVEHKITYQQDGTYTKVSREFDQSIPKNFSISSVRNSTDRTQNGFSFSNSGRLNQFSWRQQSPLTTLASILRQESSPRITYHRLKKSVEEVQPPPAVRRRPNCVGLPECSISLHHVSFDQVTWLNDGPEMIRFEFAMSPSVPYLASIMDKCATLLVPVGEGGNKVLLKQCSPVEDFRFNADQ